MALKAEIKLEGLKELEKRLAEMGGDVEEAKKRAGKKGAEIVQKDASARAPRRTGKLAANIVIEEDDDGYKVGPGKDAWYGMFSEIGTYKMAPIPYLRPAFDANKSNILEEYKKELKRAVKK